MVQLDLRIDGLHGVPLRPPDDLDPPDVVGVSLALLAVAGYLQKNLKLIFFSLREVVVVKNCEDLVKLKLLPDFFEPKKPLKKSHKKLFFFSFF